MASTKYNNHKAQKVKSLKFKLITNFFLHLFSTLYAKTKKGVQEVPALDFKPPLGGWGLDFILNYKIFSIARVKMIIIVIPDTDMGNHTGAIHGFGIRNNTSIVVKDGGHFINIYNDR